MKICDVINEIEYEDMDISELRFIIIMYLKSHSRKTQRHIDVIEYNRFCFMFSKLINKFSN